MLDVNHADDDSVWCYNDEWHCILLPENSLPMATYYSLIYTVDGAMHFIYSNKYNTNSAEDSSDMN